MAELALPNLPIEPVSAITQGDGWERPLPGLTTETASPSIAELVEVIGEAATCKLCDLFGGISRLIGSPAPALVDAIGLEAAQALRRYWGGGRIYIPRRALSWQARHDLVRKMAAEGLTRQAISQRVRISERQVYSILSRTKVKATRVSEPA